MKTEDIENSTLVELTAYLEGYKERYYALSDLFIVYNAMPVYQMGMGRKAPRYQDFIKGRQKKSSLTENEVQELLNMIEEQG